MVTGRSSPAIAFAFTLVVAATVVVQVIAEDGGNIDAEPIYNTSLPVPMPVVPHHISRIIGGKPTSIKEFPWQVRISPVGCGGSILSTTWILSAAHCFAEGVPNELSTIFAITVKRITIYAGLTDLSQKNSDPDVQIKTINGGEIKDHLFVHEDYKKGAKYNNDIALIKLKKPLTLNEKVKPISLGHTTDFDPKKEAIASGWGRTSDDINKPKPDVLQYVGGLELISKKECKMYWGISVTDRNVCHKTMNKNICRGDSGGALITGIGMSNGPPYIQIGINSFGAGFRLPDGSIRTDCEAHYPGVFTDVTHTAMKQWIAETMSEHVDCTTVFTEISDWPSGLRGNLHFTFPNTVATWSIKLTFDKDITGLHTGNAEIDITSGNTVTLSAKPWNDFPNAGGLLDLDLVIYFSKKPKLSSVQLNGEEQCK